MHSQDDAHESQGADLFDREQVRNYVKYVAGSVRRRRALAGAVVAGVFLLAVLGLWAFPSTYHVEAKLLAQKNAVLAVRGDTQDAAGPTRGAVEAVHRRDNLVALIEATDLIHYSAEHRAPAERLYDALRAPFHHDDDQDRVDSMVERLEKKLNVWTSDGTVSIAIDWSDPRMAAKLVDLSQQNFLETRHAQEITALAESIGILQSHAGQLRANVDEAVAALEKLRDKRNGAARPDGAAGASTPAAAPIARRAAARREASPEAEQLLATINAKRRALDDLEEMRRHRLSDLQVRLTEQRATYTDNHPVIIDLKQTIASLQTPSPQIKALREEVASLRAEYEKASGEAHSDAPLAPIARASAVPPELPSDILRLDQELREDKDPATVYARGELRDAMDKYAALRTQIQTAQIDLETAQAAFKYRYNVVTPAKVPKKAAKPNVPVVLFAALVAGILLSLFVAVMADVRSGKLCERWQIERLLDQPILGEIEVARLPAAAPPRGYAPR